MEKFQIGLKKKQFKTYNIEILLQTAASSPVAGHIKVAAILQVLKHFLNFQPFGLTLSLDPVC